MSSLLSISCVATLGVVNGLPPTHSVGTWSDRSPPPPGGDNSHPDGFDSPDFPNTFARNRVGSSGESWVDANGQVSRSQPFEKHNVFKHFSWISTFSASSAALRSGHDETFFQDARLTSSSDHVRTTLVFVAPVPLPFSCNARSTLPAPSASNAFFISSVTKVVVTGSRILRIEWLASPVLTARRNALPVSLDITRRQPDGIRLLTDQEPYRKSPVEPRSRKPNLLNVSIA